MPKQDDIDRDHPEFAVWNSPAGQAPSNFRSRLDPALQGNVENRADDPSNPLSLAMLYIGQTPTRAAGILNHYFPRSIPRRPWAAPGSLADQAGINDIAKMAQALRGSQ